MTERAKLYWIWSDMRQRCKNPNHRAYKNYGGRGIRVCDRWKRSFADFLTDIGTRPEGALLDRTNNDKGYYPGNIRWVTRKEQNSNRRNCIFLFDGAERITLREYCRRYGLTYRAIVKRIRRGWSMEDATSIPMGKRREK